jgi:hypothetical protein
MWWPGTELNRRRQPFQNVAVHYIQQLASRGRLRKSFSLRASHPYYGLHCGLRAALLTVANKSDTRNPRVQWRYYGVNAKIVPYVPTGP